MICERYSRHVLLSRTSGWKPSLTIRVHACAYRAFALQWAQLFSVANRPRVRVEDVMYGVHRGDARHVRHVFHYSGEMMLEACKLAQIGRGVEALRI